MDDSEEQGPPGSSPASQGPSLTPLLLRMLAVVLVLNYAGALLLVLSCRWGSVPTPRGPLCADVLPALEQRHSQLLDTLVSLLAGAGLMMKPQAR